MKEDKEHERRMEEVEGPLCVLRRQCKEGEKNDNKMDMEDKTKRGTRSEEISV